MGAERQAVPGCPAPRVRLATSLAMISAGNESQTQGRYMRAPRGEAQGSTPTA
jgi:coenzyme F420-reducing hydrogenase gamma subunit